MCGAAELKLTGTLPGEKVNSILRASSQANIQKMVRVYSSRRWQSYYGETQWTTFRGLCKFTVHMSQVRYIVVEGPIGVGKTSLAKILANEFQARTVFERVEENPFLPKFYKARETYAFQNQTFFLLNRYQQQVELAQQDLFSQNTVADYLFAKDQI